MKELWDQASSLQRWFIILIPVFLSLFSGTGGAFLGSREMGELTATVRMLEKNIDLLI